MGLGTTELILILVIVLVLFGARKLPEIGSGLAKGIKS
ncbi:MAG: twin-arginine translocase TatA/TatE family subunit, partial [Zetaproteobacteria bacterium]|nr:twin-arginine translocase TatA/TatE family subunit [Zetaproteobacteria bacterium]